MNIHPVNIKSFYKKENTSLGTSTKAVVGDKIILKFQGAAGTKSWENLSFRERVSYNVKQAKIQPLIPVSLFSLTLISGMFIFGGATGMLAGIICLPPVLAVSLEPIVMAALKIKK